MKTVIMNFSGVYPEEDFYRQKAGDYEMVDFTHAEGVNCYCTSEQNRRLRKGFGHMAPAASIFWIPAIITIYQNFGWR